VDAKAREIEKRLRDFGLRNRAAFDEVPPWSLIERSSGLTGVLVASKLRTACRVLSNATRPASVSGGSASALWGGWGPSSMAASQASTPAGSSGCGCGGGQEGGGPPRQQGQSQGDAEARRLFGKGVFSVPAEIDARAGHMVVCDKLVYHKGMPPACDTASALPATSEQCVNFAQNVRRMLGLP
jgi:hypothetical protein